MDLIVNQLYDFGIGIFLGCALSLFYICYRLLFSGKQYSRRVLFLTDCLWWLFAIIFTVGCLFWLQWGALRFLFFVAFLLGFLMGYFLLWNPLVKRVSLFFVRKPKPSMEKEKKQSLHHGSLHSEKEKKDAWITKPFDFTARNLYKGFSYGRGQYVAVKKKKAATEEKWKRQIQAEKQKMKQKFLCALWPKEKREEDRP